VRRSGQCRERDPFIEPPRSSLDKCRAERVTLAIHAASQQLAAEDAVADVAERDVRVAQVDVEAIDLLEPECDRVAHLRRELRLDSRSERQQQEHQLVERELDAVDVADRLFLECPTEVAGARIARPPLLQRQYRAYRTRRAFDRGRAAIAHQHRRICQRAARPMMLRMLGDARHRDAIVPQRGEDRRTFGVELLRALVFVVHAIYCVVFS